MSHPFTPDGEILLNQVKGDIERPNGNGKGSEAHESQTKSRQSTCICEIESKSTCICEIESFTEGCQTADQVVASDQIEENLDVEMEMGGDEYNHH